MRTIKYFETGSSVYYLDGSNIMREVRSNATGSDILDFFYDEAGDLFGFQYDEDNYYYIRNAQNDITGILDSDGTVVVEYSYDTWGKMLAIEDGAGNDVSGDASHIDNINPFRYRGYYYDSETGLYYLQSRYYDPQTGRFLNADGQLNDGILGNNMFAYCENNPVNCMDPDGRRTYVINGINNTSRGIPSPIKKLIKSLSTYDRVVGIGAYFVPASVWEWVRIIYCSANVLSNTVGFGYDTIGALVQVLINLIKYPLKKGEKIKLIGYSGGGQIAMNLGSIFGNMVSNIILVGVPVAINQGNISAKINVIWSSGDALSWPSMIQHPFSSFKAGSFGHKNYFDTGLSVVSSQIIKWLY